MFKADPQILVIDDDPDIGEYITIAAQNLGFNCIATTTAVDFMAALNPNITLIVMDLIMPETDGIELLRMLEQKQCKSRIVLMSGVDKRVLETAENLTQSMGLSVVGVLQKPFRLAALEEILQAHARTGISSSKTTSSNDDISAHTLIPPTKAELQRAIEREEFVLYYHPQIDIATRRVVGLEALVRWQHPVRGIIPPDNFISLMESCGLIDALGLLVAKRALSEIKKFVNQDGTTPRVSINVSPYALHNLQFPDILLSIAEQCDVEPTNIILEITESGLFKELTSALDILARLRLKKFNLSIDDFGAGYAMMEQLQHVPATELKIDRSLIQNMHQETTRVMIIKIIEMGHALGMQITAEGVESTEQLEFLRKSNCNLAQGNLFTCPLPVPELQVWIKKYNAKL